VQSLRKQFGDVNALDGLDLVGPEGDVLALLGPNGAGKTTLVRALATLLVPDSGSAFVLGHDIVADPFAVRREIGLAGQFAAVDEILTGRENLEMVGQLYHLGRRRRLDLAATLVDVRAWSSSTSPPPGSIHAAGPGSGRWCESSGRRGRRSC
jgi:ABC-2 type transport system ATP-binding protein